MTTPICGMMNKVEQYLTHKRSLGYKMQTEGYQLRSFARYADLHAPDEPLTVDLALSWATASEGTKRLYHAKRLDTVRAFARYLVTFEPGTEIPPTGLLGPSFKRVPPYIYTSHEISALINESLTYQPSRGRNPLTGLRNATVIGLLACTGMRIGEVLALNNGDVDLDEGIITVRHSKNLPMRLVPITDSAVDSLRRYQKARDERFGHRRHFRCLLPFSAWWASCVPNNDVRIHAPLRERIGLNKASGRNPCLHDLRHTFACNHLLRAYRENRNIDNAVHELSIYLGHATLAGTYWYLNGVPALLEQCIKRGEAQGLRYQKGGRS